MTKIEDILPEIREGRRFRPHKDHRWESLESNPNFSFSGLMRCETWELEPELEEIDCGGTWTADEQPNYGMRLFKDGEFIANMTHEGIDSLHAASLRVRGIKDSPEYRDPTVTEWYAVDNEETRLDWFKKGHGAGWDAYEKARKERS